MNGTHTSALPGNLKPGGMTPITVRAMPEGFLSDHLVRQLTSGAIVRLAAPTGDFVLPNPPPAKMLFLVGGLAP